MKLLLVCLTALWATVAAAADADASRMTVTGMGAIDSVPDMATITVGVTNEAQTAGEAMGLTSTAVAAILGQLTTDGLEPRDMQTRDLYLNPVWSNRSSSTGKPPAIVGFQASNTVIIRVRDLKALGGILDRVIQSGANTFQGLSFGLQAPGPALDQAREAAVADALHKAQLYAKAAGLTLGPVLDLSESGGSGNPMPLAREVMAEAVPVAQGEVTTSASVTMVFSIEGGAPSGGQ